MQNDMTVKGWAGEIPVYCSHDEIVPVEKLKPNPKNPNRHPGDQVELLAKVIQAQGWRQPVKVSTRSGLIVSGHGRYSAALLLECPVPVDYQEYRDEAEELSDLLADNRIAELSELDKAALAEIFQDIDAADIDASLSGYTGREIDQILKAVSDNLSEDDFEQFFEDADEDGEKEPSAKQKLKVQCPHCGEWFDV